MKYLSLALLLVALPACAADVTISAKGITQAKIDAAVAEAAALTNAHATLGDEPTVQQIADSLASASPYSLIEFSKAAYDAACSNYSECDSKQTQACGLLGGAAATGFPRMFETPTKQVCVAKCDVSEELFYRIKFECAK